MLHSSRIRRRTRRFICIVSLLGRANEPFLKHAHMMLANTLWSTRNWEVLVLWRLAMQPFNFPNFAFSCPLNLCTNCMNSPLCYRRRPG